MNLNSRKDYIEPEYVSGVVNNKGEQVIRPLNDKEKQWLNQYYEEAVVTNFYHDTELRKLNKLKKSIIVDDTIKTLLDTVKELQDENKDNKSRISELKQVIKLAKKQNEETYSDSLEDIEEELQERREKVLLYPDKEDHKEFYNQNNSRNNCLFNKSRIMGKLTDLNIEEYDAYVTNTLNDEDCEYVPEEEILDYEKVKEILDEVVDHFKKKPKA